MSVLFCDRIGRCSYFASIACAVELKRVEGSTQIAIAADGLDMLIWLTEKPWWS